MSCPDSYHAQLKAVPFVWESLRLIGLQEIVPGVAPLELRNCNRCPTTLSRSTCGGCALADELGSEVRCFDHKGDDDATAT